MKRLLIPLHFNHLLGVRWQRQLVYRTKPHDFRALANRKRCPRYDGLIRRMRVIKTAQLPTTDLLIQRGLPGNKNDSQIRFLNFIAYHDSLSLTWIADDDVGTIRPGRLQTNDGGVCCPPSDSGMKVTSASTRGNSFIKMRRHLTPGISGAQEPRCG